jgi:hypothetical protein
MPWYDYSPATSSGLLKPYVAVRLLHGNRWVDSGADRSLIDVQYAELVGLDRADAEKSEAIGASGATFEILRWPNAPLELQFGRERFAFSGFFADFGGPDDAENLMGRSDFFQRFIVQFWEAAEMMNIDLSPDFPVPIPAKPRARRRTGSKT